MNTTSKKPSEALTGKGFGAKKAHPEICDLMKRIIKLEDECMLMQQYMANNAIEVEDGLLKEYARFSWEVKKLVNSGEDGTTCEDESIRETFDQALRIHRQFCVKTQPANAISIKYTEFSKRGYLERNQTINWLIFLTILSLVFFLFFSNRKIQYSKNNPAQKSTTEVTAPPAPPAIGSVDEMDGDIPDKKNTSERKGGDNDRQTPNSIFLILSASALGAGFYTLITVRRYLVKRTYNPRYNITYMIRFILGITSGTILALTLAKDVSNYNYSTETLALVGGFAADAVAIVLKRIAEILKTALTGSGSDTSGIHIHSEDNTAVKPSEE